MKTKIIEVTNYPSGMNWGKFLVGKFDIERDHRDMNGQDFFGPRWTEHHHLVLDIETGEGAIFSVHEHGWAPADLDKHRIWVCPMFEPFLKWLYKQDLSNLDSLPDLVQFTEEDAPSALAGYRRPGPGLVETEPYPEAGFDAR